MESANVTLRDNEIRAMFRKLHNAYMDMISSPFYTPGWEYEVLAAPVSILQNSLFVRDGILSIADYNSTRLMLFIDVVVVVDGITRTL